MTLLEKSCVTISSLASLPSSVILDELVPLLDGTSIEAHKPIYEELKKFNEANGKYPDYLYLVNLGFLFEYKPLSPFSEDFVVSLMSDLKKERLQFSMESALQKGDFTVLDRLIGEAKKRVDAPIVFNEDEAFKAYQQMKQYPSGILTGIKEIDDVLHGLSYGTLTVLAGGAGAFKSTTAVSITYNALKSGFNVVFLSFELMQRDTWYSFFSRHSSAMGTRIKAESIKKCMLTPEEEETLVKVIEDWKTNIPGKMRVLCESEFQSFTPGDMTRKFRELEEQLGRIDMIVFDQIQAIRHKRPDPRMDEKSFMNDLVSYFKDLSKSFSDQGLITLMLSQVNREGMAKIAKKRCADYSVLAEVNALERDAHSAIVLWSDPGMRAANSTLIQVIKDRTGKSMPEMVSIFVDPEVFLVGSEDYGSVFSQDTLNLIGSSGDESDFI